jgi:phosphoglycolate phosphatase
MMAATKELCQHFFPDTIEVAIGEDEASGIRKKPAPDTVFEALRQISPDLPNGEEGLRGVNAVYVGDSEVDLATAYNASLPCIAVSWGFRDKDFLVEQGAKTIIDSPSELLNVII